jgi:hypothetical protein
MMPKLTVAEIAEELLELFELDDGSLGIAMEVLYNRVRAQEADQELATKMLQEAFLVAMRRSNEKELREKRRPGFAGELNALQARSVLPPAGWSRPRQISGWPKGLPPKT